MSLEVAAPNFSYHHCDGSVFKSIRRVARTGLLILYEKNKNIQIVIYNFSFQS